MITYWIDRHGRSDMDRKTLAVMRALALIMLALYATVFAVVWSARRAHAAPPPVGSDDWNIMIPYKDWVTSQHDTLGRWCCDIGDGRPVEARINDDHWEVHVEPKHFPDEPDAWLRVPDDKIVHEANPTGSPILWLYQGKVQCFAPPDGV